MAGSHTGGRLIATYATDASGNVTGLVGPDGVVGVGGPHRDIAILAGSRGVHAMLSHATSQATERLVGSARPVVATLQAPT